jgi:hypothetical protein
MRHHWIIDRGRGWVVAMRSIGESDKPRLKEPIGTRLLTVEFEDGTSVELPERLGLRVGYSRPDARGRRGFHE